MEAPFVADLLKGFPEATPPSPQEVEDILDKGKELKGLSPGEAFKLLSVNDGEIRRLIGSVAGWVKERIYGKRVVLFAPLYLSNYCLNDCVYCGFRAGNREAKRKALSLEEAVEEARALEKRGYKRALLVIGEDERRYDLESLLKTIRAIYRETGIRILHLNAPPMEVEDFRRLRDAGIGVYQLFQETYHRQTYSAMHRGGRKRDYLYRLTAMDRAIEGGFKDVGIGVLLGLYDYRFDVASLIAHSWYLYRRYGTHAHTISLPRLRPAPGAILKSPPHPVTDEDLKHIVSVCRISLPSVGIVISTREPKDLRDELIKVGVSQISAGSRTEPGGYARGRSFERQFDIFDTRPLEEVIEAIIREGLMPSLCTSCYRVGREGKVFTEKTLRGEIKTFCHLNAILTLKEYLLDSAGNGVRQKGEEVIRKGIEEIEDEGLKEELIRRLKAIEEGRRDLFF